MKAQIVFKYLAWALAGIFAISALVEAFYHGYSLPPEAAALITLFIIATWLALEVITKAFGIGWITRDGQSLIIRKIGWQLRVVFIGMLVFLLLPKIIKYHDPPCEDLAALAKEVYNARRSVTDLSEPPRQDETTDEFTERARVNLAAVMNSQRELEKAHDNIRYGISRKLTTQTLNFITALYELTNAIVAERVDIKQVADQIDRTFSRAFAQGQMLADLLDDERRKRCSQSR